MVGAKPAPPEMVCTWPATAPGLTTGSSRVLTTLPGHDMRKKASDEPARATTTEKVEKCILLAACAEVLTE